MRCDTQCCLSHVKKKQWIWLRSFFCANIIFDIWSILLLFAQNIIIADSRKKKRKKKEKISLYDSLKNSLTVASKAWKQWLSIVLMDVLEMIYVRDDRPSYTHLSGHPVMAPGLVYPPTGRSIATLTWWFLVTSFINIS